MNHIKKIPSHIKALAFDMDDTLIAFDAVTKKSWHSMVERFCAEGNFHDPEKLLQTILETSTWYWSDETRHREGRKDLLKARKEMVILAFKKVNLSEKEAVRIAVDYTQLRDKNIFVYQGAYEILEKAKNEGFKMALITNGQAVEQRKKIERFQFEQYFDHIMVEGELGYGKPEKRFYVELLQRTNESAENIAIIGDNYQWEVLAPKQFGFFTVWHDWKKRGIPLDTNVIPDITIQELSEFKSLI